MVCRYVLGLNIPLKGKRGKGIRGHLKLQTEL
jgi:hypothetical protein